jgi:hypothetical protein
VIGAVLSLDKSLLMGVLPIRVRDHILFYCFSFKRFEGGFDHT